MRNPFCGIAMILIVGLAACASRPPEINFQRAASGVHTIAIFTPAIRSKPTVCIASCATKWDAWGGYEPFQTDYLSALEHGAYHPQAVLVQDVASALQEDGFTVTNLDIERPTQAFLTGYSPKPQIHADAYLDVVIESYGYLSRTIVSRYRPMVGLQYRLVRESDGAVLMQGIFGYSMLGGDVEPAEAYAFTAFDDVVTDSDRSIAGLNAGFALGAKAIGDALK